MLLQSTIFRIINQQQPKLYVIFFTQINPNEHFCTEVNSYTFDKGVLGGGGGNSPPEAKEFFFKTSNNMEAFPFTSYYLERELHTRCVGPRSGGMFPRKFLIKMV